MRCQDCLPAFNYTGFWLYFLVNGKWNNVWNSSFMDCALCQPLTAWTDEAARVAGFDFLDRYTANLARFALPVANQDILRLETTWFAIYIQFVERAAFVYTRLQTLVDRLSQPLYFLNT